jgi:hypothetical protein
VAGAAYWLSVRRPWQRRPAGRGQAGSGEPAPALADSVPGRAGEAPERAETPLDDVPAR